MSKVVEIKGPAIDPDVVLREAKGVFKSVMVIGWDADDCIEIRVSKNLNAEACLWLAAKFQHKLLNGDYQRE
jgi:hypothetical protein